MNSYATADMDRSEQKVGSGSIKQITGICILQPVIRIQIRMDEHYRGAKVRIKKTFSRFFKFVNIKVGYR